MISFNLFSAAKKYILIKQDLKARRWRTNISLFSLNYKFLSIRKLHVKRKFEKKRFNSNWWNISFPVISQIFIYLLKAPIRILRRKYFEKMAKATFRIFGSELHTNKHERRFPIYRILTRRHETFKTIYRRLFAPDNIFLTNVYLLRRGKRWIFPRDIQYFTIPIPRR